MELLEMGCESINWIDLAGVYRVQVGKTEGKETT